MKRSILILIALISLNAASASADWPLYGAHPLGSGDDLMPFVVPDGNGGAFLVGNNPGDAVIVQRINGDGTPAWAGAVVGTADYGKYISDVVADGAGGVIVGYTITNNDGYAQRVSAGGQKLWANGIKMYDACCAGPALVATGDGGAVAFFQFASFIGFQRIGPAGAPLYPQSGHPVAATTVNQFTPDLRAIGDAMGGYIVMWKYQDANDGIDDWHAQRVDANGNALWGPNGVVVNDYPVLKEDPDIAPDGTGGFVAVWSDGRNPYLNIYAQRIDASGNRMWATNGVGIAPVSGNQRVPRVLRETSNPTWLVAWRDIRVPGGGTYAQRININGGGVWPAGGVRMISAASFFDVVLDESGGSLFAAKVSVAGKVELRMQRFNQYGTSVWGADKTVVSQVVSSVSATGVGLVDGNHVFACAPGVGGVVQRVELTHGEPGRPEPDGVVAADNPQDQGGAVLVQWNASQLDARPNTRITSYTVYRAPAGTGSWVPAGSQPARYSPSYSLLLTTPEDNTPYDWRVRALTSNLNVFWESEVVTAASSAPVASGITPPALSRLTLGANVPNPFGASTALRVGLPVAGTANVDVFDVAGRRVAARRVDGLNAGWNTIDFDGRDDDGRRLASGVYIVRVRAAGQTATHKFVIQR
ncbi:MAG: T9SS type A sorting domain-containing protein [Candidatus Krumholzibacteria bacterium]|nr:T9SS type A sorting domain-containing protein [Candidatus Krumholzibacteria bacterium]MDH4336893.1 T9SS type A sorting domain-containing protein [Candidatus Krumholzibacteria bacterium]MDH5269224.1 T9SS type A sorting domain-containing protein [Candidatus Krumholzibacteria bacterium]